MRSGLWIGVLAAAGLATGVLGASFTSRAIHDYRNAYVIPPQDPFGTEGSAAMDDLGYAPPEYEPVPRYPSALAYKRNEWEDTSEPDYGTATYDRYASAIDDPQPQPPLYPPEAYPAQADAAADAAERAGAAAQEVLAAERGAD